MRRLVGMNLLMVVCAGPLCRGALLLSPFSSSSTTTRFSPLLNCFVSSLLSCSSSNHYIAAACSEKEKDNAASEGELDWVNCRQAQHWVTIPIVRDTAALSGLAPGGKLR